MKKLLIVDDDSSLRGLVRLRLSDTYEVFDTEDPEQALALALEKKPDAILLDLMMPTFSGFDLCQSFRSLSYTSNLPIFFITGQAGSKCKEYCATLGAADYFGKPIDFKRLKERLATELEGPRPERRSEVRLRTKIRLKLKGIDIDGNSFEEIGETENVSPMGFLCTCAKALALDSVIEIYLPGAKERFAGKARVVRKASSGLPWHRYGFQFNDKPKEWVLNG